ncbi:MAG: hypothetical protein ACLFUB_18485, partial [Cyclobacteriaceae bacterium]
MSYQQPYIVQYVGFQTALDASAFLKSWIPFASSFKSAGIEKIDIYQLSNRDILSYLSRNVWTTEAYLKNFPSGVPGAARTQDVNVLQFGGYWLEEDQQVAPESMTLLFQRSPQKPEQENISRGRVTKQVPFAQMLVLPGIQTEIASTNEQLAFPCSHLESL